MGSKDAAFYEFLYRLINMTGHFIHANAAVLSLCVNTELTNPVKLSPLAIGVTITGSDSMNTEKALLILSY